MIMNNEKFLLKTCEGDEELDEVLVEHALHDRDHDHLGTIVIMMTLMVTRMMLMTLTLMTISLRMTLITLTLNTLTLMTPTLLTLTLMTISARMKLTPKTPQSEMRMMEAVAASQILQQYYLW